MDDQTVKAIVDGVREVFAAKIDNVESKLDDHDKKFDTVHKRIDSHIQDHKWLSRALFAAFLTTAGAFILAILKK